jgi:CHAT domain-containing protein
MEQLDYRDFEVEIAPGDRMRYPVAVLHSPSGQARSIMHFPFDQETLGQQLARLENALLDAAGSDAAQTVQHFGSQLFDVLIRDEVRSVYDMSRQATAASGQGLRIKLRINAPGLAAIPWEFLYDTRQAEFVALSRRTPIVRYLELPLPDPELPITAPLRILGMVANPADVIPLDVEREKARLEDAVHKLQKTGRVELAWLEGQTWRDLQAAMQSGPWHIFHFIGHAVSDEASGQSVLLLADDSGDASPLGATQLGRLLADHRTLRLALLNACQGARGQAGQGIFSSIAAILVQRGLPAVLAMQYAITDEAAIEFTTSFYRALVASLPIDAAVSEARKAISLAIPESIEWGTPVLYMRAPDGVIWKMEKTEADMSADKRQNWWDNLPGTIGNFSSNDIDGDVIIATVGAGAKNVAVGKNITQAIYERLGEPTPGDKQIIQEQLAQVKAALKQAVAGMGESAANMAQGMLAQIEQELLKTGQDETPNATTIIQMGDLLLNSVPQIAEVFASLFATPAVGRVVAKAGEAAVSWVKERFGAP